MGWFLKRYTKIGRGGREIRQDNRREERLDIADRFKTMKPL